MVFVAVPVALVPSADSYQNLLIVAFSFGIAGSSFAVGAGYVSRWYSMESQGSALVSTAWGNIGQSAAVFLGPVAAAAFGFRSVYLGMSIVLVVWAAVFAVLARNASHTIRPKRFTEMVGVLAHEPLAWALAVFYFLTFGEFVAFSIYLPTLLRDQFGLRPADGGVRTGGFVVLATLCRPVRGWLSDRIGGSRVLCCASKDSVFASKMKRADGLVIVAPEYNHGDCGPTEACSGQLPQRVHTQSRWDRRHVGWTVRGSTRDRNLLPVMRELGLLTIFWDVNFSSRPESA